MLHLDLPTLAEFIALRELRADFCVSIYLPATTLSQNSDVTRIGLKNAVKAARLQLSEGGFDVDKRDSALARIEALDGDYEFWRVQANSLAVLATANELRTFRLANHLIETVQVADRYHLKPILRAISFRHNAFVLAFSQKEARLIEVFADLPAQTIPVPGLPPRVADAVDKSTPEGRDNDDGIHNAEHQNKLLGQYAKQIDAALQPVLRGSDIPLVLAATGRLAPVYRAANTYSSLLPMGIEDSPDRISNAELASAARPLLEKYNQGKVVELQALFDTRRGQKRTTTDLSEAARAVTLGAVEMLLVDLDRQDHGSIDPQTGAVTIAVRPGTSSYDVIDEIAGRALATGARVMVVRRDKIPEGGPIAAILRYPVDRIVATHVGGAISLA